MIAISEIEIHSLKEYENNPRNNDNAVAAVAASIKEFGFKVPIVIDAAGVIIAGHTRAKAAAQLGMQTVPCIVADDLTEEQIRAFRLADNKTGELAEWDFDKLDAELAALAELDMTAFGFDMDDFADAVEEPDLAEEYDEAKPTLQEKYIVPPFSVFDTKQGYWQDRKEVWKKIIKSDEGRDEGLLGDGLKQLAKKVGSDTLTGTSIFDPVLCEVLISWFCPEKGKVLDPFAGGSVRGLVSVLLGREYTGIDLSEKQIKANVKNYKAIADRQDLNGDDLRAPNWINDDSTNIDLLVKEKHDFLLTCPPYADLEVYSDDPRDISNMPYAEFKAAYTDIISKATAKLKENAFAAIVVGEVRDKHGNYYNFVGDTVAAFKAAGLEYYNECILLNQIATGAMRADRQFSAGRKVVKTHQNVLIFVKGKAKEIPLSPIENFFEAA